MQSICIYHIHLGGANLADQSHISHTLHLKLPKRGRISIVAERQMATRQLGNKAINNLNLNDLPRFLAHKAYFRTHLYYPISCWNFPQYMAAGEIGEIDFWFLLSFTRPRRAFQRSFRGFTEEIKEGLTKFQISSSSLALQLSSYSLQRQPFSSSSLELETKPFLYTLLDFQPITYM